MRLFTILFLLAGCETGYRVKQVSKDHNCTQTTHYECEYVHWSMFVNDRVIRTCSSQEECNTFCEKLIFGENNATK